ncbi:GntR family transcriptional regulator [Streptomyces sp. NPDC047022]|uniref:GntR family transcriptional regulator n=1 Tax=Streptomyces sp. NPDC047022 TaxID=3155737 RepID=UPI0033EF8B0E
MSSTGLPPEAVPGLERPGPLRERVYEALLDLITTRTLPPGHHLVESELAARLGVSRQPVREALQRLKWEGWVDLRPAQGAFVRMPTDEDADQLLAVRTLLESEAARLAAANADSAGAAALRELCTEGERAAAVGDQEGSISLSARFHAKVRDLAGNAVLAALAAQVDRRARWYSAPAAGKRSWAEHRDLAAAIADRDEQHATLLMHDHTEHTRRSYHARAEP